MFCIFNLLIIDFVIVTVMFIILLQPLVFACVVDVVFIVVNIVRERPKIKKKWNPLRMTPTPSYLAYTVGKLRTIQT